MITTLRISTVTICLFLSGGCSLLKKEAPATPPVVPASYSAVKDSVSSAQTGWRTFYADSFLVRLIDSALVNNQDLMMAYQRIEAGRANILLRRGQMLPVVEAAASAGRRRFGKYTMDGVGNYDTRFSPNITRDQVIPEHLPDYFIGFQASWEADIWGKLRNRRKAAVARFLASTESRNLLVTRLVSDIALRYYELLALDNELQILQETIVLQENALAIIRFQKEAGKANELAVKQFEAQLFRSRAWLVETRQNIVDCEAAINFLTGRFGGEVPRARNGFGELSPQAVHAGLPSHLLQNRPDIREAELKLAAAKADVNAARAALYPSFSISGSLGYQAFNAAFLLQTPQSLAYGIFASLAAPVINRSALKAAHKSVTAERTELLLNYRKTILQAFTEVYTELARISNLQELYRLKEEETRVLTQSIETSSELFRSGKATYLEVLVSQQNALRTKLELVKARMEQMQATVNVYRAIGGGWR